MKKFTILVDMDDTLENLSDVWINELNQRHGLSVKPEDITDWNIAQFFPTLSRNKVYEPLHEESTWKRLEPLPGAQESIKRLSADGHDIIILTSAHPDTVKWKFEWISQYFPEISIGNIVFCSRKQLVRGDFLIDDGPHNLFGGVYTPIMFSAPHNRGWKPKTLAEYNVYCTDDWPDTERLIRYLAEFMNLEEK